MKLNIGSGGRRIGDYASVDLYAPDADQRVDLFTCPWPWPDSSVEAIVAFNFLEHVPDLPQTVREIIRILKPGGELWFLSPHWHGANAPQIDHRQFIGWGTCQSLCTGHWMFDEPRAHFRQTYLRLHVGFGLDWLANLRPSAWEKFGLLAPEEIEWRGVLVK